MHPSYPPSYQPPSPVRPPAHGDQLSHPSLSDVRGVRTGYQEQETRNSHYSYSSGVPRLNTFHAVEPGLADAYSMRGELSPQMQSEDTDEFAGAQYTQTDYYHHELLSPMGPDMTRGLSYANSTVSEDPYSYPPTSHYPQDNATPAFLAQPSLHAHSGTEGVISRRANHSYHRRSHSHAYTGSESTRRSGQFGLFSAGNSASSLSVTSEPDPRSGNAMSPNTAFDNAYPIIPENPQTRLHDMGTVETALYTNGNLIDAQVDGIQPPQVTNPTSAGANRTGAKKKSHICMKCPPELSKPFGTPNDLDRHMKTKHKMLKEGSKVYVCQGKSCVQAGKTRQWPRKDNFKSHCKTAHSEVGEGAALDDLVRRSEIITRPEDIELSWNQTHLPGDESQQSDALLSQPGNCGGPLREFTGEALHESSDRPTCDTRDEDLADFTPAKRKRCSYNAHLESGLLQDQELWADDQDLPAEKTSKSEQKRRKACNIMYVCDWEQCGKQFRLQCDLKKHRERHRRPWGCTNARCNRVFGSKHDWKRHEVMLHKQKEIWECGIEDPSSFEPSLERCHFGTTDPFLFRQHLQEIHTIFEEAELDEKAQQRRVGSGGARNMWCGFCRDVLPLQKRYLRARQERFDHIDDHFREGKIIGNWFPPGSDKPKSDLYEYSLPESSAEDDSCSNVSEVDTQTPITSSAPVDEVPIDPQLLNRQELKQDSGRMKSESQIPASFDQLQWICPDCQTKQFYPFAQDDCSDPNQTVARCNDCVLLRQLGAPLEGSSSINDVSTVTSQYLIDGGDEEASSLDSILDL